MRGGHRRIALCLPLHLRHARGDQYFHDSKSFRSRGRPGLGRIPTRRTRLRFGRIVAAAVTAAESFPVSLHNSNLAANPFVS